MKTLKIMSIIGLVLFPVSLICLFAFNDPIDYESAIGWGIYATLLYATLFGIAYAIIGLIKSNK